MSNPIKGIPHIQIYDHPPIPSIASRVDYLLDYQNIINHLSFFHKSSLIRRDHLREEWFKMINYDFGNDFIGYIAQGDESKVGK